MDIRKKSEELKKGEILSEQKNKLNDSLIFNIIKKIQVKMAMEEKYQQIRMQQMKP